MRHHRNIRTLGRKRDERKALLRSLARSLVRHGRVTTTEAKAKELRPFIEKLVTKARPGTLAAERLVIASLDSKEGGRRLVKEIAPRYRERSGGYTRIVKLPRRAGDASTMAAIEFI